MNNPKRRNSRGRSNASPRDEPRKEVTAAPISAKSPNTKFVNLTRHAVVIANKGNIVFQPVLKRHAIEGDLDILTTIEPSGIEARCNYRIKDLNEPIVLTNGLEIPRSHIVIDQIIDLPDPVKGVIYITSTLVAQIASMVGRNDVFAPNAQIRDDSKKVIACLSLASYELSVSLAPVLEG